MIRIAWSSLWNACRPFFFSFFLQQVYKDGQSKLMLPSQVFLLRSQLGLLQYSLVSEGPTHPSTSNSFVVRSVMPPPSTRQVRDRERIPWPQVAEQADQSVQQLQVPRQDCRLQTRSITEGPPSQGPPPSQTLVRC